MGKREIFHYSARRHGEDSLGAAPRQWHTAGGLRSVLGDSSTGAAGHRQRGQDPGEVLPGYGRRESGTPRAGDASAFGAIEEHFQEQN